MVQIQFRKRKPSLKESVVVAGRAVVAYHFTLRFERRHTAGFLANRHAAVTGSDKYDRAYQ